MASEGKDSTRAEGKEDDKASDEDIFQKVAKFCMSSGFEKDFEDFAAANSKVFEEAINLKAGDEHNLEFHRVYREYLDKFEGTIQRYVEENGSTVEEFQALSANALKEEDEFSEKRFFIEALLATTEYEHFLGLMKNEVRRIKALEPTPLTEEVEHRAVHSVEVVDSNIQIINII